MINYTSSTLTHRCFAVSMQGGRPENQDDMGGYDTPLGFLVIVCDGMGGGPGGKTASAIVKTEMASVLGSCEPPMTCAQALQMAVSRAQSALEMTMRRHPEMEGMGSTFVALLVNDHSAFVAHAGDSRCYRLHGHRMLYRSTDHSLVAELVGKKVMTEEEARTSPQSNVITRALGATRNHVPQIDEMPYRKGDRFVLCTDGIWGAMPEKELIRRMTSGDISTMANALSTEVDRLGMAAGGGHDNHTIAVVEMDCNSQLREKFSWQRWLIIGSAAVALVVIITLIAYAFSAGHEDNDDEAAVTPPAQIVPRPTPDNGGQGKTTITLLNDDGRKTDGQKTDSAQKKKDATSTTVSPTIVKQTEKKDSVKEEKNKKKKEEKKPAKTDKDKDKAKAGETAQRTINVYDKLLKMAEADENTAKTKVADMKKNITALLDDLVEQTKGMESEIQTDARNIRNQVDKGGTWNIDQPDKKTKKHGMTQKSKNQINKQKERLGKLKAKLSAKQ